jgi:hypothetical protein
MLFFVHEDISCCSKNITNNFAVLLLCYSRKELLDLLHLCILTLDAVVYKQSHVHCFTAENLSQGEFMKSYLA